MSVLISALSTSVLREYKLMRRHSNHNMDKRGAYQELYQWMTAFLDEKWGRGGTVRHA